MDERPREENVTVVETRDGGGGGTIALIVLVLLVLLGLFLFRDSIFAGADTPEKIEVDVTTNGA